MMYSDRFITGLKIGSASVLGVCVAVFVVLTLHWPLVNDASLIHYMSFLIDQGQAPYRDFGDMNMPGSLLADWIAVHLIGGGALAWRIFDLALMALAGVSIYMIVKPYGWFAGVFGTCLLLLFHGRDGMAQLGQRDLQMAVMLLVSYAFLFCALRGNLTWPMFIFGIAAGMATTIKPTALAFAAALLIVAAVDLRRRGLNAAPKLFVAIAGLLLPILIACCWLWRFHALTEFCHSLHFTTAYYASLSRKSLWYLLKMSMSPSMRLLALIAAVISWKRRDWRTMEGAALIVGIAFGLANFVIQGKGYVYHRYPLLALLAVWVAVECCRAIQDRGNLQILGVAGVVFGCLVIAPLCLRTAIREQWSEALLTSLQDDLTTLGGAQLSGRVQCIDSISGCGTTLCRMRLVQSTGQLSDFLIFGPEEREGVRETRASFSRAMLANPPKVIVVTSWLHLLNMGDYKKLAQWPQFEMYLTTNYDLYDEHSFPPLMTGPQGYRVYVLKGLSGAVRR